VVVCDVERAPPAGDLPKLQLERRGIGVHGVAARDVAGVPRQDVDALTSPSRVLCGRKHLPGRLGHESEQLGLLKPLAVS
jgi:hypothetical protein